jgi:hypothetical protein
MIDRPMTSEYGEFPGRDGGGEVWTFANSFGAS